MVILSLALLSALPLFGFWSRKKADDGFPPPPEWASFFTPERYAHFEREVRRYFQRNEIACQIHDGVVYLMAPGETKPNRQWGLQNLAQTCNMEKTESFGRRIEEHFNAMRQGAKEQEDVKAKMGDFAAVRDLVGVRLGSPEMPREFLIWREDIPGVISYIVLDLPSSMVTVNGDSLNTWGISSGDLFAVALGNLRKQGCPRHEAFEIDKGIQIIAALGDSFFTASHVLLLEEYPEFVGTHGSLVSVPHRRALLCYPINDLNVVGVVHRLWSMTAGMEKQGPGSISPQIYWYFKGKFTAIPCAVEGNSLSVRPPEAFVDMLKTLPEPGARTA
jgi:hypothetical protein